jgi:1-deoxy-D-xylulose-5-phosphate reductoisomerase
MVVLAKNTSMTKTPANDSSERDVQGVVVLGATGSIGMNTLDVVARHPGRFRVLALTANNQVERLRAQCERFVPELAVMNDSIAAKELKASVEAAGLPTKILSGLEGLKAAASLSQADIVMASIVGAAGLEPTLAAIRAGKRVLIANKEPLVMSGRLFIEEAQRSGAQILPIDSEHNAIFQCMPPGFRAGEARQEVRRIILTCSGGPFRTTPIDKLRNVTPDQACAHPNWRMGRKISVDSATLMNKGLELIEACWLFGVAPDQVEIVIHSQSVIHSMVEYADGSVLAQLGNPDMRTPISHALAWPERMDSGVDGLDLCQVGRFDFEPPDFSRFPCLRLAYDAARIGGTAPAILNAGNEVAVQAFLERRIGFTDIPRVIEYVMSHTTISERVQLDTVLSDDAHARQSANHFLVNLATKMNRSVL